jgi:orotidine-5'-phosphate decarboxylase
METSTLQPHERIIFPLDDLTTTAADERIRLLAPYVGAFKVGSEFATRLGDRQSIELVKELGGKRVMFDRKYKDIPKTVERTVRVLASLDPWLCTVHASGNIAMLKAAVVARGNMNIAGVTVLTSMTDEECRSSYGDSSAAKVADFAQLLVLSGCQAIVCSPKELEVLADVPDAKSLLRVIPGIRPEWAAPAGQTRFTTPAQAIRMGADFLVIGDPINSAKDPVDAAKRIADEIAGAYT